MVDRQRWRTDPDGITHLTPGGTLPVGGGGGNSGGMEARVARLEVGVSHLERDVSELRTDVRDIRDRLTKVEAHMATKGFVVASLLTLLAAITALSIFQGQVQGWLGILPKP